MNLSSITNRIFVVALGLLFVAPVFASEKPYPLEYWALRDVVSNVRISPDGDFLALMKIPNRDGNPVIEVYDTSDFKKKPFAFNADPMEITSFNWVGSQDIIVRFRQRVRDKIEGFNQGVYETKLALLDVKEEKVRQFRETNPRIENLLPNKPNKIIISLNPGGGDRLSKVNRAFRPRSYYEFDLENATKKLLASGKISMGQAVYNDDGFAWSARGYDRGKDEFIWYAVRRVRKNGRRFSGSTKTASRISPFEAWTIPNPTLSLFSHTMVRTKKPCGNLTFAPKHSAKSYIRVLMST